MRVPLASQFSHASEQPGAESADPTADRTSDPVLGEVDAVGGVELHALVLPGISPTSFSASTSGSETVVTSGDTASPRQP
jgi:hypothetical protein